jgi:hypothetical protein
LLAPPHDYKELAVPSSYLKWSVTQDGFIKRAVGAIYGPLDGSNSSLAGQNIWMPSQHTSWWPQINYTDYKSSLHGMYGRAVHLAAFHSGENRGFTMSAIAAGQGSGTLNPTATDMNLTFVLVRLAEGGGEGGGTNGYRYWRAGDTGPAVALANGGMFYGALLQSELDSPFAPPPVGASGGSNSSRNRDSGGGSGSRTPAMQVVLNYGTEGQRLVAMAHTAIGDTLANYVGDQPNYGDGSAYWSIHQNDNGSLPLITFALGAVLGCTSCV